MGYCYYHIQDFTNAAECYEQLTQLHPEVEEYKVYYAQSLYKAGAYPEATKASFVLDNPSSHTKVFTHTHKHTHTHTHTHYWVQKLLYLLNLCSSSTQTCCFVYEDIKVLDPRCSIAALKFAIKELHLVLTGIV